MSLDVGISAVSSALLVTVCSTGLISTVSDIFANFTTCVKLHDNILEKGGSEQPSCNELLKYWDRMALHPSFKEVDWGCFAKKVDRVLNKAAAANSKCKNKVKEDDIHIDCPPPAKTSTDTTNMELI